MSVPIKYDLIAVGGGAAGFFTAINYKKRFPRAKVAILEASSKVLSKVAISGGGRCNVTHACWEPKELAKHYPRGQRELLGPFHSFACGDTVAWFDEHGVSLKIEDDGRMFPETNTSETIVNCFTSLAKKLGIELQLNTRIQALNQISGGYKLQAKSNGFTTRQLMWCTGSSEGAYQLLEEFGIELDARFPSLFSFNIKDKALNQLLGLSVDKARVQIPSEKLRSEGPLLITHWGLSGPVILKLSAWGAISLFKKNYQFEIAVNWMDSDRDLAQEWLEDQIQSNGKRQLKNLQHPALSKRLWNYLVESSAVNGSKLLYELNKKDIEGLLSVLCSQKLQVKGRTRFKEEFVTCGGVNLKEMDFKRFEHKRYPGMYFAGEVLNIDAITGGFNFQNAWTGAWIAAQNMS